MDHSTYFYVCFTRRIQHLEYSYPQVTACGPVQGWLHVAAVAGDCRGSHSSLWIGLPVLHLPILTVVEIIEFEPYKNSN
jgi:hypothetical protein